MTVMCVRRATVVLDFETFWVGLTSVPVRVRGSNNGPPSIGQPGAGRADDNVRDGDDSSASS